MCGICSEGASACGVGRGTSPGRRRTGKTCSEIMMAICFLIGTHPSPLHHPLRPTLPLAFPRLLPLLLHRKHLLQELFLLILSMRIAGAPSPLHLPLIIRIRTFVLLPGSLRMHNTYRLSISSSYLEFSHPSSLPSLKVPSRTRLLLQLLLSQPISFTYIPT